MCDCAVRWHTSLFADCAHAVKSSKEGELTDLQVEAIFFNKLYTRSRLSFHSLAFLVYPSLQFVIIWSVHFDGITYLGPNFPYIVFDCWDVFSFIWTNMPVFQSICWILLITHPILLMVAPELFFLHNIFISQVTGQWNHMKYRWTLRQDDNSGPSFLNAK